MPTMQGQRRFRQSTADQIRVLLSRTRSSPRPQQKVYRQAIRDLGFYISDFGRPARGFGPEDFEQLIRSGQIEVVDND